MIIDLNFILSHYLLFGYTEFWGTIFLFSAVLYFFTKRNFVENPELSQFQLFYPALTVSLLGALFYGVFSFLFIILFVPEYREIVSAKAMAHIPKSFSGDTEGIALGLVFMYEPIFQLVFKFIGASLFGLFYSLFLVNHFLWFQEFLKKYKNT
jgi:hypothetical protein